MAMITLVVDRSGSMETIYGATQKGLTKFLGEQRDLPGSDEVKVSLYTFDDMIEIPIQNVPLMDCVIEPSLIVPRGSTALFDALGMMFANSTMEPQIVVILTDGAENSSRTYSKFDIMDKIAERRKLGWTFIFLAANQDAIASGAMIGIPMENACTFGANAANVGGVFKAVSDSVKRVRTGENAGFTQLERQTSNAPRRTFCEDMLTPRGLTRQTCEPIAIHVNDDMNPNWYEHEGITRSIDSAFDEVNIDPLDVVAEVWICRTCSYKNKYCNKCTICGYELYDFV